MLRRGFTLAIRDSLLQSRPTFPSIRFNNVRTGWASPDDIAKLLAELPEYLRAPIGFAYITGWRLHAEVLSLTWANVATDAIRLEVGSTKSGAAREWPLAAHPGLAQLIADQRGRRGIVVPWVFHRKGKQIGNISVAWKSACKRAGLTLIPHDLRRSAARNLERAGVPRSVIMRLCGWESEAMFRRYAVVGGQDLADGVARLAAYQGAAPSQARGSTAAPGEMSGVL